MFANSQIKDVFGQGYILQTQPNAPEFSDIKLKKIRSNQEAKHFIRHLTIGPGFWRRVYHTISLSPAAAVSDIELNQYILNQLVRGVLKIYKVEPVDTRTFNFSDKGIILLKSIEKLSSKPYNDQTGSEISSWVEGATIGYGHLIDKGEWDTYKNGITKIQAEALFKTDLKPFVEAIQSEVTVNLKQHEFDALVLLIFNIGQKAFSNSSVLKLINNPNAKTSYTGLEQAWKAWNKSQGKKNNGLINRRQAEWNIYSKGVYKKW